MRYARGTLIVSGSRDVPALVQARNSKFITHQQLFEFMKADGYEYSRNSFNWRIKRLLSSGYLSVCNGNLGTGTAVYRITVDGLLQLEKHGHFATVLNSKTLHLPNQSQLHHALELNGIHLALVRAGILATWRSDVETASGNTISTIPLGKDYDAVVDVWNGNIMARFALEYERTLKSARQYERIRCALNSDSQIGCVLYLSAGVEIVLHLARELSGIPKRLGFATAAAFYQQLLDTPVITHPRQPVIAFRELLQGIF